MDDHPHDYSAEVVVCSVCHRTEADITRSCHHCSDGVGRCWWCLRDAARAKDAEAHAAALAAKDAEIADLTRKLHWFTAYTPCHWTKGEIEYTTDCGQIALPVSKTPDGKCHGCGRQIVVSVPA